MSEWYAAAEQTTIWMTSYDDFLEEQMPTQLPRIPHIGESIQSATEHRDKYRLNLKVINIVYVANCVIVELGLSESEYIEYRKHSEESQ